MLIINGKIYTMSKNKAIYDKADVLIENGKITQIEEHIDKSRLSDDEIINAEGMIVMPGIIDAHCHVGMWEDSMGFEGSDGNEATEPITTQLRAIDGINPMDRSFKEAYKAGITSVVTGPGSANVLGGQFVAMKTYGHRIDDMIIKEPAAVKAAFGENPKTVYNERKKMPTTRMAIAALLRSELIKAQEYMEKLALSKKDPEKKPERDLGLEALGKVLRKEIPLKVHAHRADDIFTAIRIAREFDINITLDHCTEGHLIVDDLLKEGFPAIVGPTLSERSKIELKNLTFKTPGILSNAGMKIALMTDHPVIPLKYLPLCAGLAVKDGMDYMEALKAITINAAEITGISDRVGSLEPGKDADIAIFDGDPLEIKTNCVYTIINGRVID